MTGRDEAHPALGRERRFVVPDGVAPPNLDSFGAAGPSESVRLTAEYFDTPDAALARAGAPSPAPAPHSGAARAEPTTGGA